MLCTTYNSPLGPLFLATDDSTHLTGLWLDGQKYFPASLPAPAPENGHLEIFIRARDWLDRYFANEQPHPGELPLAPRGSGFRQIVWQLLCDIPYGRLTTYGALARQTALLLGRPHMSAQAVGGAVAHNPISLIIPCHRVVGADGSLTGYAGGLSAKKFLLAHEGADPALLSAADSPGVFSAFTARQNF